MFNVSLPEMRNFMLFLNSYYRTQKIEHLCIISYTGKNRETVVTEVTAYIQQNPEEVIDILVFKFQLHRVLATEH